MTWNTDKIDRVRDLHHQHREQNLWVEQLKQRGLDFTDTYRDSLADVSRVERELTEELKD